MDRATQDGGGDGSFLRYRLCPRCLRAVPDTSAERYCINDGTRLLDGCPLCGARIASPYAHYCGQCGAAFASRH